MKEFLRQAIKQQVEKGAYRRRLVFSGPQSIFQRYQDRDIISFCSNDYLGLANHADTKAALVEACHTYGVGSGAAHLINGHSQAHHDLELALARMTQRPAALLFSTGYMANLACISALLQRHDVVFADRLVHASLIDACKLSGAKLQRFPHNQPQSVTENLSPNANHKSLLVSEGVFSMDGDQAPLKDLAEIAANHHMMSMIDDAHGFGVYGPKGGGSILAAGLNTQDIPIMMATLGKAMGNFGAFIAGDEELIDYLIQFARPYIFTTATPPALAYACLVSVEIAQQEQWRRDKLFRLVDEFRSLARQHELNLLPSHSPIQGIILKDNRLSVMVSEKLLKSGFLIKAIRPPTVPQGSARLRITLCCDHESEHIKGLIENIAQAIEHHDGAV